MILTLFTYTQNAGFTNYNKQNKISRYYDVSGGVAGKLIIILGPEIQLDLIPLNSKFIDVQYSVRAHYSLFNTSSIFQLAGVEFKNLIKLKTGNRVGFYLKYGIESYTPTYGDQEKLNPVELGGCLYNGGVKIGEAYFCYEPFHHGNMFTVGIHLNNLLEKIDRW